MLLDKLLENPTGDVVEILSMGGRIDEAIDLIDEFQKNVALNVELQPQPIQLLLLYLPQCSTHFA
jgi:hypothetical protein